MVSKFLQWKDSNIPIFENDKVIGTCIALFYETSNQKFYCVFRVLLSLFHFQPLLSSLNPKTMLSLQSICLAKVPLVQGFRCQFHKHFICVTYGQSQISLCILKTLQRTMFIMNSAAYFARIVGYGGKMLMTFTTGGVDVHMWTISNKFKRTGRCKVAIFKCKLRFN